jgi:hypothetical protein
MILMKYGSLQICGGPAIEIAATSAKPHLRGVCKSPKGDFANVGAVSTAVSHKSEESLKY